MEWIDPPERPRISTDEVHLWRIPLERDEAGLERDRSILSDDERRRAGRRRFELHRRRFLASHAALRRILGRYLDRDADSLRFAYGEHGKPHLLDRPDDLDLRFNLTDSADVAICAVTVRREVGVDLERIRREMAFLRLAERWFAPSEIFELRRIPEQLLPAAFFATWTRKEAYVKAHGGSIIGSTRSFAVTVDPGERRVGLMIPGDERASRRWSIRAVPVDPGFCGALAIEGGATRRSFRWNG